MLWGAFVFFSIAQIAGGQPSLSEQVHCIKEDDKADVLTGIDPLVEAGLLPSSFKKYSKISGILSDFYPQGDPDSEQTLRDEVSLKERFAGKVEVTKTDPENPNTPQDPNSPNVKKSADYNVTFYSGRDYESEEGKKQFQEDLRASCEMMSKAFGIELTEDCIGRQEKMDKSDKEFIEMNREFADRLNKTPMSEWSKVIDEEVKKSEELFKAQRAKDGRMGACYIGDPNEREKHTLTKRSNVQNTARCFAWSPVLPDDYGIFSGVSYSGKREIGSSVSFSLDDQSTRYAAPIVARGFDRSGNYRRFYLNPAYLYTLFENEEAYHRAIAQSQRYGPGPITFGPEKPSPPPSR